MSVRAMAWVWEQEFGRSEQIIMLALADHANDAGERVFPSVARIAWKTGYSGRQVRRVMARLRDREILEIVREAHWDRPTEYRIRFDKATPKPELVLSPPDIVSSPDIAVAERDDIATSERDDIAVSAEPSLTIINHQTAPKGAEDKPLPASGGKRTVSAETREHNKQRSALLEFFQERTGLRIPKGKNRKGVARLWWNPIREICELSGWDRRKAQRIVSTALTDLSELTISDPNSILKTARAIAAKQARKVAAIKVEADGSVQIGSGGGEHRGNR